ncbi:putative redox protein, regulator of disulfide bond formation [Thermoplasmatales archaeon SCGC AB-540-F20]|nr:putative redox protein, regulator of disulfide bond formation [Thermoplasmatales archaeon SCGC AB-540-F20]
MDMEINFPGGKKVDAIYKGFTIKTDQPEREGGEGISPEPFSLFLASIGTCTGIYVLSFCQKRNINTDGVKMILRTEKNKETHMINKISMEIQVPKDFPDNYKNAIIKTAGLCTVKKHLEKPPDIDISVKKIGS